MAFANIEFKARCARPEQVVERLLGLGAELQGVDQQTDVYYRSARGRLKRRRGTIENSLLCYDRPDDAALKPAQVHLAELPTDRAIDKVLDAALDRDVVVSKQRQILWIDNVKFHIDDVASLGSFLEVEATDRDDTLGTERLRAQGEHYKQLLGIADEDLEARSYSDLLRDHA